MKAFNNDLVKNPLLEFLEKTYLNEGKIIYDALMDSPYLIQIQEGTWGKDFILWKYRLKVKSELSALGSKINRFYKNEKV